MKCNEKPWFKTHIYGFQTNSIIFIKQIIDFKSKCIYVITNIIFSFKSFQLSSLLCKSNDLAFRNVDFAELVFRCAPSCQTGRPLTRASHEPVTSHHEPPQGSQPSQSRASHEPPRAGPPDSQSCSSCYWLMQFVIGWCNFYRPA